MPTKPHHSLRLATFVFAASLIPAGAFARDSIRGADDANAPQTTGSGGQSQEPVMPLAPVGHRQPRAADLPAPSPGSSPDDRIDSINRSLDHNRSLQICRGC